MDIALQIRKNAEEYKTYHDEFLNWEKDIKKKDQNAKKKWATFI